MVEEGGVATVGSAIAAFLEVAQWAKDALAGGGPAPPVKTMAPGAEIGSLVSFTTMQGAVSRNMVESLSIPMLSTKRDGKLPHCGCS
ncbi:hypothetical protein Bca101_059493 [Brassica carinata]